MMLYRIRKDLLNWMRTPKLWVGLTIGLSGFLVQFVNLLKLVRNSEFGVNIFEIYAIGCNNTWAMTISVSGLIFSLSDIPYLSQFEMNAIYRSSKLHRLTEKFVYSIICSAIYFLLQFVLTIIISLAISYTDNVWSFFSIAVNDTVKEQLSPASAALVGLLMNFMYGTVLIGILFFLSLLLDKAIALAAIFTFQAIQHFLMLRLRSFSYFCLFRNSILNYHGGISKELVVNLFIEFVTVCATYVASIAIRNKISYNVRQEENTIL